MAAKLPDAFADLLASMKRELNALERAEQLSRAMRKRLVAELELIDRRLQDVIEKLDN